MPEVGQLVLYRLSSTRTCPAVIAQVVSGSTCHLDVMIDEATDWPNGSSWLSPVKMIESIDEGTGVGEWQVAVVPEPIDDAISTAVAGVDLSGRTAVATAGTSPGIGLDTARQPSTTRPVRVVATGTFALTSTLILPATGAVELRSDSASTPTTKRGAQVAQLSGVVASMTVPWSMTYDVPAGHYYKLVTSGTGVALDTITETIG